MLDPHYTHPRLTALYDADSPWSEDRDFYLALAGTTPTRVLDLGCGTGLLTTAYARAGHHVTGVDPAAAMLNIARHRQGGDAVDWVQATAGYFRSDAQFDLIIMTGHAFQVLLQDADIRAALTTMQQHLAPGGRAVFESRNPGHDWASEWMHDYDLATDDGPVHITRRSLFWQGDMLTFEHTFHFNDEVRTSRSTLRFLSAADIAARIDAAGLKLQHLHGGWLGEDLDASHSQEMVFTVMRP
jgi:ubiquinone/menaquinone biosynthesis C-methylase UbiE